MKRVDPAALAAWADKREEAQSRQLQPAFWGTVTGLKGSAGNYQVQVVKTGEDASDGHWHLVQANGQVPVTGDRVQLHWQDENVAVATSILNAPRVADQHNLKARIYWTGATTLSAGWSHIPYTAATANADPSGMFVNGDITTTIPGWYLVVVKTGITGTTSIAAGIFRNSVQSAIGTWADNAGGQTEAIAVEILHCNKGDAVQGYIYNVSAGASLLSDATANYLSIHLLSAD